MFARLLLPICTTTEYTILMPDENNMEIRGNLCSNVCKNLFPMNQFLDRTVGDNCGVVFISLVYTPYISVLDIQQDLLKFAFRNIFLV